MNRIKIDCDFFEPRQRVTIKKEFDIDGIEKILVQGIDQLGGLAQSTPFFSQLRAAFPKAYIVNLVGPLTYGLMQNCPYVNEVWLFNKKKSFKIAKKLKQAKFDLTFLATGSLRSALIAYLGNIPNRVGYNSDGRGWLLTVMLKQELHSRYRVENLFDMLRAVGKSPKGVYDREVWLSDSDLAYADKWQDSYNSEQSKVLVFNPFSTDPKRRWTDEGWKELLKGVKSLGIKPFMLVAPNESEDSLKLVAQWGHEDILVQSHQVTNTAAIMDKADFVIGPESGFIHLALGLSKPHVLALFNVLPPRSTFPVKNLNHLAFIKDDLPCCPCYLYKFKDQCPNDIVCMTQMTAEPMLKAIAEFLQSDAKRTVIV